MRGGDANIAFTKPIMNNSKIGHFPPHPGSLA